MIPAILPINIPSYHKMAPGELVPDDPSNPELEAKRKHIDLIGSLAGTAGGAGIGAYMYRKNLKHRIPRILAIAAAGYGLGASGARFYGSIVHPRQAEIRNIPQESSKTAADIGAIDAMATTGDKKAILGISRAYRDRVKLDIAAQADIKKRMAMQSAVAAPKPAVAKSASIKEILTHAAYKHKINIEV